MEYLFAASRVVLGVGNKTPIPNLNNETIKMVFANSSFTANEAKAEIIKYRDKAASLLSGPLGWLYHKDLVNYFNKLLGE